MLGQRSSIRNVSFGVLFGLTVAVGLTPVAAAQGKLAGELKERYRITEINTEGVAVNPGAVMTIEADGINAEPYPTMITFENPVVDGQVKQRSKGFGLLKSTNLQILQPGQKVYITKINEDTGGKEDVLKVTILTSDAMVATFSRGTYGGQYQVAKRYSTTLAFKEPKGTLEQMSLEDASKMIEAVLSENPADQGRSRAAGVVARSCQPHCAVSATTGAVVGGAANVPQSGPQSGSQSGPQTVALGQTIAHVTATLGTPTRIVDLGSKKIYTYPDMKIVFIDGKVSDVQ